MNDDKLAQLHELLKEPLRQKILFKLDEHDGIDFDELITDLKIDNRQEVLRQLNVLGDLVSKIEDDQYLVTDQGVTKKPGGQYRLTESGHDIVRDMIAYPEILAENYEERIREDYFSKRAYRRHKIAYVLAGAGGALFLCFFGGAFFTIFSRILFGGPSFFLDDENFLFILFIISPLVGGTIGYLVGANKNFKRPEPDWDE